MELLRTCYVIVGLVTITVAIERSVNSNVGEIRGNTEFVAYGDRLQFRTEITKFLGIPFAEPPTGELRFAKPVPKAAFTSPFAAFQFGPSCPQVGEPQIAPTDEDCLTLNIYTPDTTGAVSKIPVMIFIYGGAFIISDGKTYGSDKLSAYGQVVVVTFNYRLGPLGFLDVGDASVSTNNGLRDQHLAIKWVHDNIESFGGNPKKITLFGDSAGSASVIYQSIYHGNDGLYQRAIAISGTPTNDWALIEDPNEKAKILAIGLECPVMDILAMVKCLREYKNVTNLIQVSLSVGLPSKGMWSPTYDKDFVSRAKIMELKFPTGKVDLPVFRKLDLMMGTNGFEGQNILGLPYYAEYYKAYLNQSVPIDEIKRLNRKLYSADLTNIFNEALVPDILEAVNFLYTNFDKPNDRNSHIVQSVNFLTDTTFAAQVYATIKRHASMNIISKTYHYEYNELFPFGPFGRESGPWVTGALHSSGMPFIFGYPVGLVPYFGYTQQQARTQWAFTAIFMTYLTNFAKTGNPNTLTSNWKPYTPDNQDYFYITSGLQEGRNHLHAKRMQFWNSYLPSMIKEIESRPGDKKCPVSSAVSSGTFAVCIIVAILNFLM